ncbi:polyphosphate kinase 1 [Catenisphaera adipataccumulans]|nr:polyphosphate kinase 1 [Catenisphaera adipataccumulans]
MSEKPYAYTQNRELSWLRFNERVLEEAADPRVPLLERLKFISIYTSNLDEFFMVRCGSLYDLSLVDPENHDKRSGMTPAEQLNAIFKQVDKLCPVKDDVLKNINETLVSLHMARIENKQLTKKQQKFVRHYFDTQIYSMLSPQVIDNRHPFPHLMNKAQYIIVRLKEGKNDMQFGIIPVPDFLDRIIYLPEAQGDYVLLEHVIYHQVERIFSEDNIVSKSIIRVTRNADINLNEKEIDEDEDYREYMKKILKKRDRLAPIRLEYYRTMDDETTAFLCEKLNLKPNQVFCSKSPMEMDYFFDLIDQAPNVLTKPLLYKPFEPQKKCSLDLDRPLIPQLLQHDELLFYPYQSIDIFLDLLMEAAHDKNVLSIKITIYRLAKNSRIVNALVEAAENGKEVIVLMELRARFDEKHNIQEAQILEEAGCKILYGFEDLKVHSKVMQFTVKTRKQIRTITQIGTGNYNEKTSKQYTDISYITGREDIGADGTAFFRNLLMSNLEGQYDHLLVSPFQLKEAVMKMMDEQIEKASSGQQAKIYLKMNSITDVDLINKIQEASSAGVEIRMVVRGICCILPGVPGYAENLHIISIVGRYLEHSRIYAFGNDDDMKVYISSADFMTRNTEKRVEVACPIYDEKLKKRVLEYFKLQLRDNIKARQMQSDGTYKAIETMDAPLDSQNECMRLAEEMHPKKSKEHHVFRAIASHFRRN